MSYRSIILGLLLALATPTVCMAFDASDFAQYLRDKTFDSRRLEAIESLLNSDPALYVSDVQALLATFDYDSERTKAAIMLYPYVVDKPNWYQIKNNMDYSSSWDTVRQQTIAIPLGYSSSRKQINEVDYANYLKSLSFSSNQLEALRELINTNPALYVVDIQAILGVLDYDSDRVKAAILLYPYVVNSGNWYKVENSFDYSSSWDQVQQEVSTLTTLEYVNDTVTTTDEDTYVETDEETYVESTPSATDYIKSNNEIDENGFANYLNSFSYDEQRMEALREMLREDPALYIVDAKAILPTFQYESAKVDAAIKLYPYVVNKGNWFKLKDYFNHASNWESVKAKTVANALSESDTVYYSSTTKKQRQIDEVAFVEYLNSLNFDEYRLEALRELSHTYPALYVSDIQVILATFSFASEHAKAIELLYPFVEDKGNWHKISGDAEDQTENDTYYEAPSSGSSSYQVTISSHSSSSYESSSHTQTVVTSDGTTTTSSSTGTSISTSEGTTTTETTVLSDAGSVTTTTTVSTVDNTEQQFNVSTFAEKITSQGIDTERLVTVQDFVESRQQIQVKDVQVMLEGFALESYRAKAAALLYPNVTDKDQWDTLANQFTIAEHWESVKNNTVQQQTTTVQVTRTPTQQPLAETATPESSPQTNETDSAFAVFLQNLQNQLFDTQRKALIKDFLKTKPKLTTADVAQVLKTFSLDDDRIQPAIDMYPYVTDKAHWNTLSASFEVKMNWDTVQKKVQP